MVSAVQIDQCYDYVILQCSMTNDAHSLDAYALDAQMLADLWIFRAVGRFGSITAAAERLCVTQGAVSQRILRLEARLATTLFSRGKAGVQLTAAGARLLAAMDDATTILREGLSHIDHVKTSALVVGCATTLAIEWLAPRASAFKASHGIELMIFSEPLIASRKWMEDARIDVAIQVQSSETDGLEILGEFQDYIFPVCSPAYARNCLLVGPENRRHVFLHNDLPFRTGFDPPEWGIWTEEMGGEWLAPPLGEQYFNLLQMTYRAAAAGEGVAMARAVCVHQFLSDGTLTIVPGARPMALSRYLILAAAPGRKKSPIRRFATWMMEEMTKTQEDSLNKIKAIEEERMAFRDQEQF